MFTKAFVDANFIYWSVFVTIGAIASGDIYAHIYVGAFMWVHASCI